MQLLSPAIAFLRAHQLTRQLREIARSVRALPQRSRAQLSVLTLREIGQASRSEYPHLYGTPGEQQTMQGPDVTGKGVDVGFTRVRSENPHIKLRGIALWLTVAYFETKDSEYGDRRTCTSS